MEIVLAILGLILTSIGTYVGVREYRKKKHNPELYNKRLAIYEGVLRFLARISE